MSSIRFAKALLLGSVLTLAATPALAQQAQPSTNAMVNLIELLAKQGVITKENGAALIAQAEAEAERARQGGMVAPADMAGVKRELVRQEGYDGPALATSAAPSAPRGPAPIFMDAPPPPPAPAGTLRVPYVPAIVRNQIRDEVKKEVLADVQKYGWAQPSLVPDWVKGVKISGDIRFRSQAELYSDRNIDGLTGEPLDLIDYNRLNRDGPFDIDDIFRLPLVNTNRDRIGRLRLRARLGIDARISEVVSAGFRLATGDDNSPISTNQILGGGLGKKDIWLDRAYLKLSGGEYGSVEFGRFANPFVSTPLLFDEDLNFDGVAGTLDASGLLGDKANLALTAGAFPLEFNSSDFPAYEPRKQGDQTKWLFSAQLRGGFGDEDGLKVEGAVAYHSFKGVQGQLSEPCEGGFLADTQCSTDQLRPQFLRKGNSLFFMRDNAEIPIGEPDLQFVGLTFDYDLLDINAKLSAPIGDDMRATLYGNYVRNLSFKRSDVCRYAASGLGAAANNLTLLPTSDPFIDACSATPNARFNGGDTGWLVGASFGHKKPSKWGEWNVYGNYRRLESDAVLDAFTDSDFHLGGTNAKGYVVGAQAGLFDGLTIGARWLSANEVSGPPLSIDVFQLDLSAEF